VLAGRSERELEGGSAAESASSSGVGRRPIVRVRTRLEGGGSPDRGLLDMFWRVRRGKLVRENVEVNERSGHLAKARRSVTKLGRYAESRGNRSFKTSLVSYPC